MGRLVGLVLALTFLVGCGYVEKGDLPAIREHGELRVLTTRRAELESLPRLGHPLDEERAYVARLAEHLAITPVWEEVAFEELLPALLAGRGDLVAANLTATPARAEQVALTAPVGYVREQLIVRASDHELDEAVDLAGRRVAVQPGTSHWDTLAALREQIPAIRIEAVPEDLEPEEIIYRVSTGEYDVAVADDNTAEQVLAYMQELRVAFDLSGERPLAWAVRPRARKLLEATNAFLRSAQVAARRPRRYKEDLATLRERGVLRVLTRNGPATYFVWRGQLVGFEYELARRFADELGLRLEIVLPPAPALLHEWLRQGRGDLAAAGLTITGDEQARDLQFTRPTLHVNEMVVTRRDDTLLANPEDLAGRTLSLHRTSPSWAHLETLRERGLDVELAAVPEESDTLDLLDAVAAGEIDLTLAPSHLLDIELSYRDDLRAALPLGAPRSLGWAVREDAPALHAAAQAFLEREYRGEFYNIVKKRYFARQVAVRLRAEERLALSGQISPFDELVRKVAERYRFDWRLIVAQMHEESRFDPRATSFAGAVGLMQLLPATAREMGFSALRAPAHNVEAGVRYLRRQVDRIPEAIPEAERIWFALASYNAGFGHVADARRLAARLGRDADIWFGGVETAMPLLAKPEYYATARFGYCRGGEPVHYVRAIRDRYEAYRSVTGATEPAGG